MAKTFTEYFPVLPLVVAAVIKGLIHVYAGTSLVYNKQSEESRYQSHIGRTNRHSYQLGLLAYNWRLPGS